MGDTRYKIVFVDDNVANLTLGRNMLKTFYEVYPAPSAEKLFEILENVVPDLVLLDIEMPEMNGYEVIRRLKGHEETKHIPVIFLTAKNDGENELKGLSLGAIDYIAKPFSIPLLQKRIEVHLLVEDQRKELEAQKRELINFNCNLLDMVDAKTKTLVELQNVVISIFAELIESRDDITGGHIGRTREYLRILIEAMQGDSLFYKEIEGWDMMIILQSAPLHDIGKIAIKDSILHKPSRLTEYEYDIVKTHVAFGEKVIDKIMSNTSEQAFLELTRLFVSTHHEKWDGSGYPNGLKGYEIPLHGRMMALVDVYDALISDRPYKEAYTHEDAVEIILNGRGTYFDPGLVDLFLDINDKFKEITLRSGMAALINSNI